MTGSRASACPSGTNPGTWRKRPPHRPRTAPRHQTPRSIPHAQQPSTPDTQAATTPLNPGLDRPRSLMDEPTDFEEFCHDLLIELGFVNVDWRKGTPKRASSSDRGRDLVAQRELTDVDGHTRLE